MKKLVALIAVFVVVAGAAVWAVPEAIGIGGNSHSFSLPGEVTGVSLAADPEITLPVTVSDSGQVAAMVEMLQSSQRTQPQNGERLMTLGLNIAGEAFSYDVFRAQDDLLLYSAASWYILDNDKFLALTTGAPGFYRFREHPRALLLGDPDRWIPALSSNYAYRGIQGNFLPSPPLDTRELYVTGWQSNRLPQLSFSRDPKTAEVIITTAEGQAQFRGALEEAAQFQLASNTAYNVQIIARYESPNYMGTVHFRYTLRTADIPVRFEISGNQTDLGEVLVLRAHNMPAGGEVQATTSLSRAPTFFCDGAGGAAALMPISIHTAPGEHFVELRVGGSVQRFPITVLGTQFEVQRFTIDQAIADRTVDSAAANEQFRRVIHPLRQADGDDRHWYGRFIRPVEGGRITTPFAVIRFVNNAGPTRHASIDIALPQGTPIHAPASGRVMFAGYLQLTGNTIVIEHGLGLRTWYYHMVTLDVETGDMVSQGQRIGAVGTTGFSTGPHLCYGMSVFDVFVNPDTAKITDVFNW